MPRSKPTIPPPTSAADRLGQEESPLVTTRRHEHSAVDSGAQARTLPADLVALFAELDQFTEAIPVDVLEEKIGKLTFRLSDVEDYAIFDDQKYRRNLLHEGPSYHALLLCWQSGQRSPIHDHRGSACGVRVVAGSVLETVFQMTPNGHLYPTISQEVGVDFVCANYDMDIHQISNLQADGEPLVTLHIYSPPLHVMGTYSLTSKNHEEFADPVHSFCDGAGI